MKVTYNFRSLSAALVAAAKKEGREPVLKRKSVEVDAPLLDWNDIVDLVNTSNETPGTLSPAQALLLEQANQVTHDAIQAQFNEQNREKEVDVSLLDLSKVDFVTIANTPKASRATTIGDEQWANFEAAYVPVMMEVTGKSETVLKNHIAVYQDGFTQVSKQIDKVTMLETLLNTFASEQSNVDGNEDVLNYLSKRIAAIKARTAKAELEL